tara:strand:- start:1439 stop:2284 length:846 start_codon:yes stop_codon:yes gene_type:complete
MKKHFKTLGLQEGATNEEIQAAYERLSNDLNPKNNDNEVFFKEEFEKVLEAYKALSSASILAKDKSIQQPKVTKNEALKNKKNSAENNNSKKRPLWLSMLYSLLASLLLSISIFLIEYYILNNEYEEYKNLQDFLILFLEDAYYENPDIFLSYFLSSLFGCILFFAYMDIKNIKDFKVLHFVSRKIKTVVIFLISLTITKPLLHYLLYPKYVKRLTGAVETEYSRKGYIDTYKEVRASFGDHIYNIKTGEFVFFTDLLALFIPSVILVTLLFWMIRNKIKN